MAMVPTSFTLLRISIPPVPSFPRESTHYIYLKPHAPNLPSPSSSRSLFLANVPADSTPAHFRALFALEQLGTARVEEVEFEGVRAGKGTAQPAEQAKSRKRKRGPADGALADVAPDLPPTWERELLHSGATAVVVFVDRASMQAAHKAARRLARHGAAAPWPSVAGAAAKLGLSRYRAHHALRFPGSTDLQRAVDAYMTAYASLEAARARAAQKTAGVPDEDGFVTVVRGARVGAAKVDARRAEELAEIAAQKHAKEEARREGLADFYRFQGRERRKREAEALVGRFEGEKRRLRGRAGPV